MAESDKIAKSGDAASEKLRNESILVQAEVLKRQAAAAPRKLTEPKKHELMEQLSTAPAFTVSFMTASSNETREAADFTNDLKDVFKRMKVLLPGPNAISLSPSLARGVLIVVKDRLEPPLAATILVIALRSMGFEVSADEVRPEMLRLAENGIGILVGST